MRAVLLFSLCLAPLALGNTFVQPAPAPLEEEHHGFDLVKVMHDLFTDRQDRAISNEDEDADEAAKEDGEGKGNLTPVNDKNTEKKYNQMVDGIYQGMNQRLKSGGLDPMVLDLEKAKAKTAALKAKKEAKKDAKRSHSVEKREAPEEETVKADSEDVAEAAESDLTEEARKMKINPKHKAVAHAKKNKKNMKKKNHHMKKNKNDKNKKKGDGKVKKGDGKKDDKKKGDNKKEEHKKHGKKADKKENKKDNKRDGKKHHNKNKNKHHSKKAENKKHHNSKRAAKKNTHKEMGSLSGIASLKRHGDVKVFKNSEGQEIIHSEFFIGPLSLEVTKSTNGNGKSKNVKVARAVTEKLKGKMIIKVKSDGSATVRSVHFEKPEQVNVRGSLNMKSNESKNLAEKSYARLRPVAAQRLLKIAKSIVKNKTTVQKQ